MGAPTPGRWSAQIDPEAYPDLVLFHIGARLNRPAAVRRWWPVATAMPRMLRELTSDPSLGLLDTTTYVGGRTVLIVQYWRDFDALSWARSGDHPHLPAWRAFNRAARGNDAVGVFHETFRVGPHGSEAIYVDMPLTGLAAATSLVPTEQRGQSAAHRIDPRRPDEPLRP